MPDQMNPVLAAAYGHARNQEQVDQQAVYDALDKLASADGYDISQMSDAQVQATFQHYLKKVAAEEAPADAPPAPPFPPKKEEKDEEKKDEKKDEGPPMNDEEKKAAAEMAEADLLGRQMAHAFVNELDVIQKTAAAAQAQPEQPQADPLLVELATARANEFLAEKVAANQLCRCLKADCKGDCETAKTAAAPEQPSQQDRIDQAAAQLLQANGYGHLLQ